MIFYLYLNKSILCCILKDKNHIFVEVLSPQITKKIGSANLPFAKLLKSANLRICDFRNLFADRPPLVSVLLHVLRMVEIQFTLYTLYTTV
jgi:hypothetical protein